MRLLEIYNQNKGKKPLFDKHIILHWYDGVTLGLSRLDSTEEWHVIDLFYFDVDRHIRILNVVRAPEDWENDTKLDEFRSHSFEAMKKLDDFRFLTSDGLKKLESEIQSYISGHAKEVFFLKTEDLSEIDYDLIKPDAQHVKYCGDAEHAYLDHPKVFSAVSEYFPDLPVPKD